MLRPKRVLVLLNIAIRWCVKQGSDIFGDCKFSTLRRVKPRISVHSSRCTHTIGHT